MSFEACANGIGMYVRDNVKVEGMGILFFGLCPLAQTWVVKVTTLALSFAIMQLSYDMPVSSRLPIPSRSRDGEGRPHKAKISGCFPDMSGLIEPERMIPRLRSPFGLEPFGIGLMAERLRAERQ